MDALLEYTPSVHTSIFGLVSRFCIQGGADPDHRCVIRAVGQRRNVELPALLRTHFHQALAQSRIGGDPAGHGDLSDASLFGGLSGFFDQYVHNGLLNGRTEVVQMSGDEIFLFALHFLKKVQNGCL